MKFILKDLHNPAVNNKQETYIQRIKRIFPNIRAYLEDIQLDNTSTLILPNLQAQGYFLHNGDLMVQAKNKNIDTSLAEYLKYLYLGGDTHSGP